MVGANGAGLGSSRYEPTKPPSRADGRCVARRADRVGGAARPPALRVSPEFIRFLGRNTAAVKFDLVRQSDPRRDGKAGDHSQSGVAAGLVRARSDSCRSPKRWTSPPPAVVHWPGCWRCSRSSSAISYVIGLRPESLRRAGTANPTDDPRPCGKAPIRFVRFTKTG
jgi:hypothetical protein